MAVWIAGFLLVLAILLLIGAVGLQRWARSHRDLVVGRAVDLLSAKLPSAVVEVLRRRRKSLWYKTSQSPQEQKVWGYVDRHSIDPGQAFHLMLSGGPRPDSVSGRVEIHRIGYHGGADRSRVWLGDPIDVASYGINNTAAGLGPNWPPALLIEETRDWRSGYYSIDFAHSDGTRDADIAFIVVTDPARAGDVLVKLATATYQAYNRWGGHSLYEWESPSAYEGRGLSLYENDIPVNRGDIVSFDRPTPSEFFEWEYYFVVWLEKLAQEEGFSVSYATNFDLDRDEAFASNCKLLVSPGHDEYWSRKEFDRTYDRIFRQGGNTLFLSANIAYWQVRYADVNAPGGELGRQLICYKSLDDPIRWNAESDPDLDVTARFREDARRPETMLMGVAYQSNLRYRRQVSPRFSYYVENAGLPFFEGTGYQKGDFVAEIIGHEWDNRDPEAEYGAPDEVKVKASERLWRQGRSRIDPIPLDQIQVAFAGSATDLRGYQGRAEAVYFESPAGAKVFSAGTIRWPWGLGKEGFVQESFKVFNRNLILSFLGR